MRTRKRGVVLALEGALLLGVVAARAGSPPNVFPTRVSALYKAGTGSTVIASVTPGTALVISAAPSKSGAREQVTVEGWSPKGAASVIFQAPDLRIIFARLASDGIAERKVVGHKKDPYGTTWRQVTLSGWVTTKDVVNTAAAVWAPAQTLYEARCSSCHALHKPGEFTANQWPGILKTMVKNAALDPAQAVLVTRYLQAHARPQ